MEAVLTCWEYGNLHWLRTATVLSTDTAHSTCSMIPIPVTAIDGAVQDQTAWVGVNALDDHCFLTNGQWGSGYIASCIHHIILMVYLVPLKGTIWAKNNLTAVVSIGVTTNWLYLPNYKLVLLFGPFQSAIPNRTLYFCQGVVESVNIAWAVLVAFSFTSGCLCRDKK